MNKRLPYIVAICIACAVCSLQAQHQPARVPARPGLIERVQPNGDTIHIRLHGDERRHWMTLADGKTLVIENEKGFICYAKKKKDGRIVPTCKKVNSNNIKRKKIIT